MATFHPTNHMGLNSPGMSIDTMPPLRSIHGYYAASGKYWISFPLILIIGILS
jgi:hypothetical protein